MVKITYIQPDGRAQTFEVPPGYSVMEGAFRNDVAGIIAECGGSCACGTCQVFVDPAWAERAAKPGPLEQSMIEEAAQRLSKGTDPGIVPERFLIGAARFALDNKLADAEKIKDKFYAELSRR